MNVFTLAAVLAALVLIGPASGHPNDVDTYNIIGECKWAAVVLGGLLKKRSNIRDSLVCETYCRTDNDCRAFTFIPRNGLCLTRGQNHGPLTGFKSSLVRVEKAVTGIINCQRPESCLKEQTVFNGGLMKFQKDVESLSDCHKICLATDLCALYSYFPSRRGCVIRDESAKTIAKRPKKTVIISGILNCGVEDKRNDHENHQEDDQDADQEEENEENDQEDDRDTDQEEDNEENDQEEDDQDADQEEDDQDTDQEDDNEENDQEEDNEDNDQEGKQNEIKPGCIGRVPPGVALTHYPITLGSMAISYCKDNLTKNTIIRCDRMRRLRGWEYPDCYRNNIFNTGYCTVMKNDSDIYQFSSNSTRVSVGSSLVIHCADDRSKFKIVPCKPTNADSKIPLSEKDYPDCSNFPNPK